MFVVGALANEMQERGDSYPNLMNVRFPKENLNIITKTDINRRRGECIEQLERVR
jgi:hypothetical protein